MEEETEKKTETNTETKTETRTFQCSLCHKLFKKNCQLKYHMTVHTSRKGDVVCEICGREFSNRRNLMTHLKIHTGEKRFICDICGRSLSDSGAFKRHILRHNGARTYACTICQKAFTTNSNLAVHVKSHSLTKSHICSYCNRGFHFKPALRRHIDRMHMLEKLAICCVYSKDGALTLQEKDSNNYKSLTCGLCNEDFDDRSQFKSHILFRHEKIKAYLCAVCNEAFETENEFDLHIHHHSGKDLHVCVICNKKFVEKYYLTCHMKTHAKLEPKANLNIKKETLFVDVQPEGEKRSYPCSQCSEEFQGEVELEQHMKFHDMSRPFVCGICGKRFVRKCNLKVHTIWHGKVREENAGSCDEKKSPLDINDMTMHLEECIDCGERFPFHFRHKCKEKKRYECSECKEEFLEESLLVSHMKFHDKARPYECPFCGRRFVRKCNLQVHANWHLKLIENAENDVGNYDQKTNIGTVATNVKTEDHSYQHMKGSTSSSCELECIKSEVTVKKEVVSDSIVIGTEVSVKKKLGTGSISTGGLPKTESEDIQIKSENEMESMDYAECVDDTEGNAFDHEPFSHGKEDSNDVDPLS